MQQKVFFSRDANFACRLNELASEQRGFYLFPQSSFREEDRWAQSREEEEGLSQPIFSLVPLSRYINEMEGGPA